MRVISRALSSLLVLSHHFNNTLVEHFVRADIPPYIQYCITDVFACIDYFHDRKFPGVVTK